MPTTRQHYCLKVMPPLELFALVSWEQSLEWLSFGKILLLYVFHNLCSLFPLVYAGILDLLESSSVLAEVSEEILDSNSQERSLVSPTLSSDIWKGSTSEQGFKGFKIGLFISKAT